MVDYCVAGARATRERALQDKILHYNRHWFWNWGTGETRNNGVHFLIGPAWGIGVGLSSKGTCGGNRYPLHG